jgi:glutathione S-transferase
MDVYMFSGSGYAWRVLLALEIKGQKYGEAPLQASPTTLKSPEFLALNSRGKVPVVRDGGYVLPESLAIMAYIERKYPEPPLFGRSAEETGLIWRAILDFDLYVVSDWVNRIIVPIFTGQAGAKTDVIRQAVGDSHAELSKLEAAVSETGWIVGQNLSAADVAVFPLLEALLRAVGKNDAKALVLDLLPFESRYPALAAWRHKIKAMPAYDRTYPEYWRKVDEAVAA